MVFPRSKPGTNFKILMTEEQELANQKAWENHNDKAKYGGITELEAFSQLQVQAVQAINRRDYSTAMQLYAKLSEMRDITPQTRHEFRQQYIRMMLLRDQQTYEGARGFAGVKLRKNPNAGMTNGCPIVNGKQYTIAKALKEMPIPCRNERCYCSYAPYFNDEPPIPTRKKSLISRLFRK